MNIEIIKAKRQGYTAKVTYFDELVQREIMIYLCSRIDPISEGEKWAESIYTSNKQGFLIYGLGMGYHIKALKKMLMPNQKIYVIDVNEALQQTIELQGETEKLADEQCEILVTSNVNEIERFISSISHQDIIVQMYYPCVKIIPSSHQKLKQLFETYKVRQGGGRQREQVEENYQYNHKENYANVSYWYGKWKKKPLVIVSGGPSLDKNIDWLKKVQDEVFIFASGRTLKVLINRGIKVHMLCIIDPTYELIYKQIEGIENMDIPLIFLDTANHKVIEAYKGPKYIAYSEESSVDQEGRIESGGSVATVMLDLAIHFGADPIIFIGQDLAYTNSKSHCNNTISMDSIDEGVNVKKVKSITGEYIPTTLSLLSFKWWLEQKIRKTQGIKFINATEGGAYIEGCEHRTLKSVLAEYIDVN